MANQQNKQNGGQSRPPVSQPSTQAASQSGADSMARNEPSPPATQNDELAALRQQVSQLTALVSDMIAREHDVHVAPPVGRSFDDLSIQDIRRAAYDDDRERKLTQRRMQAERSQRRAEAHVAFLRDSELELQDGPRMFEVAIPGEPRSMRLVGATSANEANGKYMENFGIIGFAPEKKPSIRELSAGEIPEITKKVQKLVKVLVA